MGLLFEYWICHLVNNMVWFVGCYSESMSQYSKYTLPSLSSPFQCQEYCLQENVDKFGIQVRIFYINVLLRPCIGQYIFFLILKQIKNTSYFSIYLNSIHSSIVYWCIFFFVGKELRLFISRFWCHEVPITFIEMHI